MWLLLGSLILCPGHMRKGMSRSDAADAADQPEMKVRFLCRIKKQR